MPYPSSDVDTTDLDAGTDSPASARVALLDLAAKFNELRNFISVFIRGLLSAVDAATARATLGVTIGTHVPSPTGSGASGTWGINVTGNAATATSAANGGVTSVNGQTGAVVNTTLDGIGSVEALLYNVVSTAPVLGNTYAGSSLLRNFSYGTSIVFYPVNTLVGGTAATGTWRCMGTAGAAGGNYIVGLFVRIS